ncbi:hypothetical protein [Acidocella aminolytica]|nr:hypothetical protein [Acidocella aminolytica]
MVWLVGALSDVEGAAWGDCCAMAKLPIPKERTAANAALRDALAEFIAI